MSSWRFKKHLFKLWKELKKQVQTLPGIVFNLIWDQCLGKGVGGGGGEGNGGEGQHRNLRERGSGNRAIWKKGEREVRDVEMMEGKRIAALNAGDEECLVQREALMQDECRAFGQDLSLTPANCQMMIKCVFGWRIWGEHCGLHLFRTRTFEFDFFLHHLKQHFKSFVDSSSNNRQCIFSPSLRTSDSAFGWGLNCGKSSARVHSVQLKLRAPGHTSSPKYFSLTLGHLWTKNRNTHTVWNLAFQAVW